MWTRAIPVLLSFLASCATAPLQLGAGERIPNGEVLVLGRVEVYEGTAQVIGTARSAPPTQDWDAVDVVVAAEAGGEAWPHRLTDGRIRWHLPPGKYGIWGFTRAIRAGEGRGAIDATFEVPEGASAVYVGTLRIRFGEGAGQSHAALRQPSPLHMGLLTLAMVIANTREMPKLLAPFSLQVVDQLDDEVRAARPFVPRGAAVARSLLRLQADGVASDSSLAVQGDVGGDGTISRIVRPVRPEGLEPMGPWGGWQEVEALEPTLEWECLPGIERAGLTYDLRISRVISTSGSTDYGGGRWTWGPVAYYRTNLPEARHRVEAPLTPASYYYWEVRLRRGDVVGPWSSYDVVWVAAPSPRPEEPSIPNRPVAERPVALSDTPRKRGAFGFRTPIQ